MAATESTISAILISPNRDLAETFLRNSAPARCFQILSDLKSYPTEQVLEMRLRQLNPEIVLLDLVTEIDAACEVIKFLVTRTPAIHVVGLHVSQDGDAIIRSLRSGATEFLWAPFDASAQLAAAERLMKMRAPVLEAGTESGTIIGFASAKPGSGASTLAAQTAFSLHRISGKRVLLIDLDLMGGTISFYLKIQHPHSLADVLAMGDAPNRAELSDLVASLGGVDILPSPEEPITVPVDPARFHLIVEVVRSLYDYVVLDLPSVFHRSSLLGFSETDISYLVTTAELPSLHLTRKAIDMLGALGFEKTRYGIIVNRLNRNDGINAADLEKMFSAPIKSSIPNDYFSLHKVVTRGEPLGGEGEIGRAIESLAGSLCGSVANGKAKNKGFWGMKPAFTQN